jgi:hypothetical protein
VRAITCEQDKFVCVYVCAGLYVCIRKSVCVYVRVFVCTGARNHLRRGQVCMRGCMRACMRVFLSLYECMYVGAKKI